MTWTLQPAVRHAILLALFSVLWGWAGITGAQDKTSGAPAAPGGPSATSSPLAPPASALTSPGACEACEPLRTGVVGLGFVPYDAQCGPCWSCRETRLYRSEILGRLWFGAEYLLWATKSQRPAALVATSDAGTAAADTGVLGLGTTHVAFGQSNELGEMRSGGRLSGGIWWTPEQRGGFEASYFALDEATAEAHFATPSGNLVARPYLDVVAGQEASRLVNYPGIVEGSLDLVADSSFSGAEALIRQVLDHTPTYRLDLLGGYRYQRLDDSLLVSESLHSLNAASGYAAGSVVSRFDDFRSLNSFHGAEAGLVARWWRSRFSLQLLGKVALGGTETQTVVDGGTTIDGGNLLPGGVLALPTNMGNRSEGRFSAVGQFGVALEYYVTCLLRLSVGYDFIAWSGVGRAMDQIDRGLNPTQFPPGALVGVARPEFQLRTTDFWAQGLKLGLEYQF